MTASTPRVLVLLAEGAEEMEVTIIVDVLRRGGIEVVLAGVGGADPVTCSRGVRIMPDRALADTRGLFDMVVLPGGMGGTERLCASEDVGRVLAEQQAAGRAIAAICAAPMALVRHSVGAGRALTSHPSVRAEVAAHGRYREDVVVEDGNLVTSRGPGTAFEFALALVAKLVGERAADGLRGPMVLSSPGPAT
jgi:protein DJ-1